MTTENNKIKLNLRPSIGNNVGDKLQSPPTKLLINHGKPNYTINRSTVKKLNQQRLINNNNNINSTSSSLSSSVSSISSNSEPINDFSKITLKKPQPIKISPIKTTTTTSVNKKYLSTVTLKKISNGDTTENNEFLQKRKQIYDKINRENSLDENGYTNKIENGGMVTPTSPKDENYVKKISENLQNGGTMIKSKMTTLPLKSPTTPNIQNGHDLEFSKVDGGVSTQNGHHKIEKTTSVTIEKPILPQKNLITNGGHHVTIVPSKPTASPPPPPPPPSSVKLSNGITVTTSSSVSMTNNYPKIPSGPNGNANFEQKTIVSFSKDLGPNNYPDVVKVVKPAAAAAQSPTAESINTTVEDLKKEVIQELSKLKFDIEVKDDVVIKPVIRNY